MLNNTETICQTCRKLVPAALGYCLLCGSPEPDLTVTVTRATDLLDKWHKNFPPLPSPRAQAEKAKLTFSAIPKPELCLR